MAAANNFAKTSATSPYANAALIITPATICPLMESARFTFVRSNATPCAAIPVPLARQIGNGHCAEEEMTCLPLLNTVLNTD